MIYVYFFIKCVVRWSENSVRFDNLMGIGFQMGQILWDFISHFISQCEIWHVCWIKPELLLALKLGLPKRCLTVSFSHQSLDSQFIGDCIGQKGGGVIILVRSALSSEDKPEFNTDCENLWVQLNLVDSKSVLIGAYYKPHEFDQHSRDELSKSL